MCSCSHAVLTRRKRSQDAPLPTASTCTANATTNPHCSMPEREQQQQQQHRGHGDDYIHPTMTMPCPQRSPTWLDAQFSALTTTTTTTADASVLVVDVRPSAAYMERHVRGSVNLCLPASHLMLRRLTSGRMPLSQCVTPASSREKFVRHSTTRLLVLVHEGDASAGGGGGGGSEVQPMDIIYKKLIGDGCQCVSLEGGFRGFYSRYPHLCAEESADASSSDDDSANTTAAAAAPSVSPLMGLKRLTLRDAATTADDDATPDNALEFPVEILPFLFLGNAKNSSDLGVLRAHNIRYILNVTPNVPNVFADDGQITYMQIAISDHWSQNLSLHFPDAIAFIEKARRQKCGVLVHCLAGISRSVTVTVAYLMQTRHMSLNDAYDFVSKRKSNISPNFNFMGQLLDWERALSSSPSDCTCSPGSDGEQVCSCGPQGQSHFAQFNSAAKLAVTPTSPRWSESVSVSRFS